MPLYVHALFGLHFLESRTFSLILPYDAFMEVLECCATMLLTPGAVIREIASGGVRRSRGYACVVSVSDRDCLVEVEFQGFMEGCGEKVVATGKTWLQQRDCSRVAFSATKRDMISLVKAYEAELRKEELEKEKAYRASLEKKKCVIH